jgi:hypothetical protein
LLQVLPQALPQAPQLSALAWVLTQVASQYSSPVSQVQVPSTQSSPAALSQRSTRSKPSPVSRQSSALSPTQRPVPGVQGSMGPQAPLRQPQLPAVQPGSVVQSLVT